MADWYVYQHDADPVGPWPTEVIAEAILAGRLSPEIWIAAPGGPRWLRALDVPVIARLVEGVPTRPRRDSGLRIVPLSFTPDTGRPAFGSTVMMVKDDEVELTEEEPPPTDPSLPPSTPTPRPVGETLESPGNDRRSRRRA